MGTSMALGLTCQLEPIDGMKLSESVEPINGTFISPLVTRWLLAS